MFKKLSCLTVTLSLALLLSLWGARPSQAEITSGFTSEGACCVCLAEGCCLEKSDDDCDAEGNLIHQDIIQVLLDNSGFAGGEICNLCDECTTIFPSPVPIFPNDPNSPTIDMCGLMCGLDPLVDEHACIIDPNFVPDQNDEVSGGSCSYLGSGSPGAAGGFAMLGGLFALLGLGLRKAARS